MVFRQERPRVGLRDVLDTVRSHEKRLIVHAESDALVHELRDYFASQNVTVTYRPVTGGARERVELAEDDGVVVDVSLDDIAVLVDGDTSPERVGADAPYRDVLERLDGATFTSYDRRQMLHATREVEDRAWRIGVGSLHAGFQRFSIFAEESATYERLATTDLDIHVYGVPDVTPPVIDGATTHPSTAADIAETWFAIYDGGPDDTQKSALIAEERDEGRFYGVLTYDPTLVDRAIDALPSNARPAP